MPKPTSLGILGAGQLAAYLCQASFGLETQIDRDAVLALLEQAIELDSNASR